mmetsp:Transcript_14995/g.30482  ORF Transcript_14995/g.30482 Transcript_14995/m.30482 type:complete len:222 (+) Transcript_14995:263-928(+)
MEPAFIFLVCVLLIFGVSLGSAIAIVLDRRTQEQLWRISPPRRRAALGLVKDDVIPESEKDVDVAFFIEKKHRRWLMERGARFAEGNSRKILRDLLDFCREVGLRPSPRNSGEYESDESSAWSYELDVDPRKFTLFDGFVKQRHQDYLWSLVEQRDPEALSSALRSVLDFAMHELGSDAIFEHFSSSPPYSCCSPDSTSASSDCDLESMDGSDWNCEISIA